MRKLDVSSITDVSEMPVKQGTLQFLQDSYAEILGAIVQALLSPSYNPATVYVLFGVSNSGSGLFYNITNGVVFYQGEIFLVDAATIEAIDRLLKAEHEAMNAMREIAKALQWIVNNWKTEGSKPPPQQQPPV